MKFKFLISAILLAHATYTSAQVTIGTDSKAITGAILQLKENENSGDNASKGLLLPRVELTDRYNLYPMLTGNETDYENEKEGYSGMFVYNVTSTIPAQCAYIPAGVYTWIGNEWNPTGSQEYRAKTMAEIAADAGFEGLSDIKVSNEDDVAKNINIPNTRTGIAWHRDQNGNIFLSSSFGVTDITGDTERWMITNLSALNYDTNVSNPTKMQQWKAEDSFALGYRGYANGGTNASGTTTYNAYPSIGLLYNWTAAVAGLNKSTTQNQSNLENQEQIQGICPNGWHLPSDYEWNELEVIINNNIGLFSSISEPQPPLTTVSSDPDELGYRGVKYGESMKNFCQTSTASSINGTIANGASNPITTSLRPGFSIVLAGRANSDTAPNRTGNFGGSAYFWTSSAVYEIGAWGRHFYAESAQVVRGNDPRKALFSVRCKKN